MALSEKIKQVRQSKGWTQAELALKLNIQQKQVSFYESATFNPSADVLIKLAEVFDVSLDYLALDSEQKESVKIRDREILRLAEAIDNFDENAKSTAKEMLKLIVRQNHIKETVNA